MAHSRHANDDDSDSESHTARLEQQLRRQIMLNHQLDHEQRDLEHRLEEAENQLAATSRAGGVNGGDSSCGDGPDACALQERLARTERELEAEQAGRLQVAEQLTVALDQLREQGTTILSLTASLDRAVKQLADADARLDLTWSVQSDLELRLEEAETATHAATGVADSSRGDGSDTRALEERLVRTQRELETEQTGRLQVTKERQRLEEQLATAHDDLIAAHRRLTGALRAQSNSAKLIARLRKS